jgi:hypothetical protein
LLNIKRLAYEVTPAVVRAQPARPANASATPLPRVAAVEPVKGIAAESLARRIDQFLVSRGYTPPAGAPAAAPGVAPAARTETAPPPRAPELVAEKTADFVCEEDVRQALRQGRKIVIGDRSIVTPAARDLGEQHRLFIEAGLRR